MVARSPAAFIETAWAAAASFQKSGRAVCCASSAASSSRRSRRCARTRRRRTPDPAPSRSPSQCLLELPCLDLNLLETHRGRELPGTAQSLRQSSLVSKAAGLLRSPSLTAPGAHLRILARSRHPAFRLSSTTVEQARDAGRASRAQFIEVHETDSAALGEPCTSMLFEHGRYAPQLTPDRCRQRFWPWHFLNFLPEPQGHGSLRPTLA